MAEEIKKRVLRLILNSAFLIAIAVALNITLPSALAIIRLIPKEGLSLSTAAMLLFIIVMAFQALRIILDLIRLVDLLSEFLIKYIPSVKADGKISVVKALKELILVIVIMIVTTILYPIFLLIPEIGSWLSIGVSIISVAISIILIYDAGKTLYTVLQSGLEFFIEKLMGNQRKN